MCQAPACLLKYASLLPAESAEWQQAYSAQWFHHWQNETIHLFYLLGVTYHVYTPVHMQLLQRLAGGSYIFLYVALKTKNSNCH
jgi:hypothetical protein